MEMSKLKEYSFESPLLVTNQELVALPAETWQSGEKWLEALQERTDVVGIVLPLEIKASAHQSRQDIPGLELLNWLRWSAEDPFRYLPVLVVAWQSLDTVLRHTPNLLLVTRGTTFVRLPEAVETLPRFIDGVRQKDCSWPHAQSEDLERIAGSTHAERVSYHDLANEFYAAYRLWQGYKYAVQTANIKKEAQRTEDESLSFMDAMQHRLNRPAVREYLASRRQQASPVYYPIVAKPDELIKIHAENGLPDDIRILMVDDEFDKGLAEVLLKMLFKASEFNFKLDGEWVYSLDNRARLVCVKSIREAACWLKHWGEVDVFEELELNDEVGREWIGRWADKFGRNADRMESDQLEEISKQILGHGHEAAQIVDRPSQGIKPTTVLLLDLHLDKREATALYEPRQLASVRLWRTVKDENEGLPILIFTASRQAMNYSAIMEAAGKSDGWLTKEGPDITLDDEHSSQAALYLLERLHMFSRRRGWHRPEFGWRPSDEQDYATAYHSPHWQECQNHVASESSRIFEALQTNPNEVSSPFKTLAQNVRDRVKPIHFPLETLLVARRLAVAAFLETATWRNGLPAWNVDRFRSRLNCSSSKSNPQYPNGVFNFTTMLWFASYKADRILGLLLPEESEWLKKTFPASDYSLIHECLSKASGMESS
jgi:hypothetical protein